MELFEPHLITKKEVRFAEGLLQETQSSEENFGDVFGGIIKSGQWGWLTKGCRLCITSLRSGQSISKYDFDATNGFGVCIVTCVSEIQMPYLKDTLIAVGIQYADSPGGLVVLYSVEESTVICCIDLKHKITCCRFISHEVSQHTILQNMNGCLAVGTDGGSVLLVDLNLRSSEVSASKEDAGISVVPCHIVDYSMSLLHLHRHFQHCQKEGVHFGIQLEVLENAEFIQSLHPIDLVLGLAVGLADGRLVLYDLTDMQVFYVAPPQERSSPLVKMSSMEPPDDPRPCVYIWAFHENYQNSMAVMHSLMYEKRVVTDDGFCYFENFQVSSVRLQLPLNCAKSVPTACQAISKAPSHGNEETISLCALVWKQEQELQTEVLLFDINQWYKEEMPYVGDWREDPSYLASFVLPGISCLDMYFDPNTISLFNSIQRPEEHFYPLSLSFDSIGIGEQSCFHLNWPGVQNRVINVLRSLGSLALLDPNPIFMEVLNARLLPQFCGLNYKATFSLKAKRETLLSVAVENNCNGLLKECAKNWSDGSHQGTSLSEGLSLSTLTDWLWARASSIKERCNKLCKVLFDHSGYTLDQREKQELCYISKQLRTLADLSSDIISKYCENIPSDVLTTLESQGNSIRMASDYQEILLWLLNIGLLPEASSLPRHREMELNLVPYPYESLHGFYEKRRIELTRYSSRKARSCYLLFIDSFLEHSFKGNNLRDSWQESGGDGLYPPTSVQAMLRIMLIPDVSFENKCALFLYFFLDLNMAIEDKRYEPIVQNFIKFPSVFKLSASLIKQIQAFWNLDHCHFQAAVDEFISPFNKDHVCPQWQIELFVASLLNQVESNLALRVLEAKSLPISPLLQLNTYLANDLISEAFHFARSEKDEELLKLFFSRCFLMKKFGVIRDLALTESEGKLVQSLLKSSKNRNAEDLSFVYLLQKYKYIEAVAYQDELMKGRDIQRSVDDLSKGRNNQTAMDIDTPTLVLSAYHTTMTPVTKKMSDVYLKIKKRIKNKETEQNSPYPLSCQLIKQNASDLLGGIYHSSALGTHFASHYWDQQKIEGNALQQSSNAPFLRSPQISLSFSEHNPRETISYPEPFKPAQKRRLDNSPADSEKISKVRENPKKRRKIFDRYDFELSTSDNLLTHFKNSTTYNQNVSNLTKIAQKTSSRENSLFLETPYVRNSPGDDLCSQIPQKLGTSLPGILKVSQPKTSVDETDRVRAPSEEIEKKKDSEEEKSIRFILPVDESLEQINEQDVSMEGKDVLKETFNESHQQLRTYDGPATRKSLRSTMSYSSLISNSKNELQGMLDKVRNEQSKQESSLKTTSSIFESNSSIRLSKSPPKEVLPKSSDILKLTESILNDDFKAKSNEQQQSINLNSTKESRTGPTTRKSLRSTISYSSFIPNSRKELQDMLDEVRNDQSKQSLLQTTSSIFESNEDFSKSSNILQVTEPIRNDEFNPKEKSIPEPTARESVKSTINYSSCTAISKNELQDILDKVKNEQSKHSSLLKTTTVFESFSSISKSTPKIVSPNSVDILKVNEPKENIDFGAKSIQQQQSLSGISKNANTTTSFSFPQAQTSESESKLSSIDSSTEKSDEKIQNPNMSQFECFSNLDSYSSLKVKPPKKALSENSDSQSNDSTQRKTKQLKGRASIHSSPGDFSDSKINATAAHKGEKITKTVLQQTKTIFGTDTIIDFKPHTSSSKVCTTESKFNKEITEPRTIMETESKLNSEKSPSKVTFSEQTTVIGELTYLPTIEVSQNLTETSSITLQSIEKEQMLDTTIGMTLYDTMGFEEHSFDQQTADRQIENSSGVDTFENIEGQGREPATLELNDFDVNEKTSENEETGGDDDNSGSSIILLSSRSSSYAVSRNQGSKSPESKSNEVIERHISIDDEDDEDNYFEENYDDEEDGGNDCNEEEEDDESIEIIESDGSEDLSNSFSNKSRDVYAESSCSPLASVVSSENSSRFENYGASSNYENSTVLKTSTTIDIEEKNVEVASESSFSPVFGDSSENSSNCDVLLQDTIKVKNYEASSDSDSLTALETSKTIDTDVKDVEGEQKLLDSKETSQPELKLCVTSESINEQDTINVVEEETDANKDSCNADHGPPKGKPITIKVNDLSKDIIFGDQENKPIEINKETEVHLRKPLDQNLEKQTEKETHQNETIDKKTVSTVQKDQGNMEVEETILLTEEIQTQPSDQIQSISADSAIPKIQIEKSDQAQSIPNNLEVEQFIDAKHNSIEQEEKIVSVHDDIRNNPALGQEPDKSNEISVPQLVNKESGNEKIETKNVSDEENQIQEDDDKVKNIQSEVVETAMSSEAIEEIQIVEAESTVSADVATTNKDSIDEEIKQNKTEEVEPMPRLRSKSFSKNLPSEKVFVASPRSRRNSRSGSMPPLKNTTEDQSSINIETTTSNVDSIDKEKTNLSSEDVEFTPKLRNRRSTSFSKNVTNVTDAVASPSTRRLSRGGSVDPPTTGNQIVTRRRSLLLETLDESSTPDSPSSRTRSKIRSDSIDGIDVDSSSISNVKRSRLSSISSITSIEPPQTPKTRRRSSVSVDKELVNTPKAVGTPRANKAKSLTAEVINTPIKTPRRLSVSKKESPSADTSPTAAKPKVQKKEEKSASNSPQDEPQTSQSDDYTLSRRLTRTQLAAMERNLALSKQPIMSPVIKKRRGSNTTDIESPPDVKGSDNESNSSRMSHFSNSTTSRRVTRSLALKENLTDDVVSIASSTESSKRKRKRVKDQISPITALKVIPEELPSGSEGSVTNSETGKRPTRHKK